MLLLRSTILVVKLNLMLYHKWFFKTFYLLLLITKQNYQRLFERQSAIGVESKIEQEILKKVSTLVDTVHSKADLLNNGVHGLSGDAMADAKVIADELLVMSNDIADACNELERIIPSESWTLPTYLEMLFVR